MSRLVRYMHTANQALRLTQEIGGDTSIESEVNDSEASVSDTGVQNLYVEASSSSSVSGVENGHVDKTNR